MYVEVAMLFSFEHGAVFNTARARWYDGGGCE